MSEQVAEERKLGKGFWIVIGGLIGCSVLYALSEFYYSEESLVRATISSSIKKCRLKSGHWPRSVDELDTCNNESKPASLVKIESRTKPRLQLINSTGDAAEYDLRFDHFAGKNYPIKLATNN